jgi:hypothetical protein
VGALPLLAMNSSFICVQKKLKNLLFSKCTRCFQILAHLKYELVNSVHWMLIQDDCTLYSNNFFYRAVYCKKSSNERKKPLPCRLKIYRLQNTLLEYQSNQATNTTTSAYVHLFNWFSLDLKLALYGLHLIHRIEFVVFRFST